jgi:hypothetical protein
MCHLRNGTAVRQGEATTAHGMAGRFEYVVAVLLACLGSGAPDPCSPCAVSARPLCSGANRSEERHTNDGKLLRERREHTCTLAGSLLFSPDQVSVARCTRSAHQSSGLKPRFAPRTEKGGQCGYNTTVAEECRFFQNTSVPCTTVSGA